MKILHCIAQLPMKTGSGVYYSTILKAMCEKGHDNAALYAMQEPFADELPDNCKKYPVQFLSDNLPFPIAGMSDVMPYNSTVYSEMSDDMLETWRNAFRQKLTQIAHEFTPDIILCHHLFLLTDLVCEVFKDTKKVGVTHGTDLRQILKHPKFLSEHMKHINELDAYVAIAPNDAAKLHSILNIPEEKITVMGGGFNSKIFYEDKSARKDFSPSIMFAGKVSDSKGVFELASATALLAKKFSNIQLHVVGNADENAKCRLLENAGEKNICIYNVANQKEMADVLRTMDVFVLPSYYEGLGLVAIEALACSIRAVTTEIKGLMWLLGENIAQSKAIEYVKLPRIYDIDKACEEDKPEYIARLAEAIERQLLKRDEEFTDEIKKEIATHSWDFIADKFEKLLNSKI